MIIQNMRFKQKLIIWWTVPLKQTLPEAQRTQDIESKTWIISKAETNATSNIAL